VAKSNSNIETDITYPVPGGYNWATYSVLAGNKYRNLALQMGQSQILDKKKKVKLSP
jgi:hypothetical protein